MQKYYNTVHLKIQSDDQAWHIVQAVGLGMILVLATAFAAYVTTNKIMKTSEKKLTNNSIGAGVRNESYYNLENYLKHFKK